jgi:hypothetical protein
VPNPTSGISTPLFSVARQVNGSPVRAGAAAFFARFVGGSGAASALFIMLESI